MNYPEEKVMQAFSKYTILARDGVADKEVVQLYTADDDIRSLLDRFANEVNCVLIRTTDNLYMVPETRLSPFHVSNDWIKRNYLRSDAVNADIYLLYFATIVLFGSFFDRYNSQEQTLQFITLADWVTAMNERIHHLQSHDEEVLVDLEKEFSYNWRAIIDKWEDMDDIKETAKRQSGNTISRLSFIDTAKRFLIMEGLLKEIGNHEVTITEKAKIIIQRFFMDASYNNNIFEFIYAEEEGEQNASD
ncbi:non-ribosomal peptide synthetase module [Virgibacillus profundi]|uniref:Non-ribosomal peptide synthetase module n=1 Tax=Virgibacillus profundi TaxID=2024555 RepID=A0A2A2II36_9BACI|nr:DUF6063 family protein [Virgibacillus profundi]PAV30773.1 non-ribosomal peptide synthetase module [Virgibacillus profundi]PXY54956.1 non-ribosomal peptide synthetase module [Virgibacillus profundi]